MLKEEKAKQDTANDEKVDVDLVHFYFELTTKFKGKWKTIEHKRTEAKLRKNAQGFLSLSGEMNMIVHLGKLRL